MSIWLIILAATAFGGAMTLWHAVSKAKHLSEGMLEEYARMLAEARQRKAKEIAAEETAAQEAERVEPARLQSNTPNPKSKI
jgi:hypothetical protein